MASELVNLSGSWDLSLPDSGDIKELFAAMGASLLARRSMAALFEKVVILHTHSHLVVLMADRKTVIKTVLDNEHHQSQFLSFGTVWSRGITQQRSVSIETVLADKIHDLLDVRILLPDDTLQQVISFREGDEEKHAVQLIYTRQTNYDSIDIVKFLQKTKQDLTAEEDSMALRKMALEQRAKLDKLQQIVKTRAAESDAAAKPPPPRDYFAEAAANPERASRPSSPRASAASTPRSALSRSNSMASGWGSQPALTRLLSVPIIESYFDVTPREDPAPMTPQRRNSGLRISSGKGPLRADELSPLALHGVATVAKEVFLSPATTEPDSPIGAPRIPDPPDAVSPAPVERSDSRTSQSTPVPPAPSAVPPSPPAGPAVPSPLPVMQIALAAEPDAPAANSPVDAVPSTAASQESSSTALRTDNPDTESAPIAVQSIVHQPAAAAEIDQAASIPAVPEPLVPSAVEPAAPPEPERTTPSVSSEKTDIPVAAEPVVEAAAASAVPIASTATAPTENHVAEATPRGSEPTESASSLPSAVALTAAETTGASAVESVTIRTSAASAAPVSSEVAAVLTQEAALQAAEPESVSPLPIAVSPAVQPVASPPDTQPSVTPLLNVAQSPVAPDTQQLGTAVPPSAVEPPVVPPAQASAVPVPGPVEAPVTADTQPLAASEPAPVEASVAVAAPSSAAAHASASNGASNGRPKAVSIDLSDFEAAATAAAERAAYWRDKLVQFYTQYNPSKLSTVDVALQQFAGSEEAMFEALRKKYNVPSDATPSASTSASPAPLPELVVSEPPTPAKAPPPDPSPSVPSDQSSPMTPSKPQLPSPQQKVQAKADDVAYWLRRAEELKRERIALAAEPPTPVKASADSVTPTPTPMKEAEVASAAAAFEQAVNEGPDWKQLLLELFSRHEPKRVPNVDQVLLQQKGKEHAFFQQLHDKYGSTGKLSARAAAAMASAMAGPEIPFAPAVLPPAPKAAVAPVGRTASAALNSANPASTFPAAAVAESKLKTKKKKKRTVIKPGVESVEPDEAAGDANAADGENDKDGVQWSALLKLFCVQNCPQYLNLVPSTLAHFRGQEQELMKLLHSKYNGDQSQKNAPPEEAFWPALT